MKFSVSTFIESIVKFKLLFSKKNLNACFFPKSEINVNDCVNDLTEILNSGNQNENLILIEQPLTKQFDTLPEFITKQVDTLPEFITKQVDTLEQVDTLPEFITKQFDTLEQVDTLPEFITKQVDTLLQICVSQDNFNASAFNLTHDQLTVDTFISDIVTEFVNET